MDIFFCFPINRPMVGVASASASLTAQVRSVDGKYIVGSSSGFVSIPVKEVQVKETCLTVWSPFDSVLDTKNNSPVSLNLNGTITFQ